MNRGETRGRVDEAMGDTGEDAAGEDAEGEETTGRVGTTREDRRRRETDGTVAAFGITNTTQFKLYIIQITPT